jgi:H+-transporting ATPase
MSEEHTKVEVSGDAPAHQVNGDLNTLTVEELYDKDKIDLSTMEYGDCMALLK